MLFIKLQMLVGDPDIVDSIMVTLILNMLWGHKIFLLFGSGLATVVGSCEHGKELLGSIKCSEFHTLRMEDIVYSSCDSEILSARSWISSLYCISSMFLFLFTGTWSGTGGRWNSDNDKTWVWTVWKDTACWERKRRKSTLNVFPYV